MTKLNKFLAAALLCLITTSVFSQFSRTEAIDLVLNSILSDDVGNIDVYCSFNSQTTTVDLIDNDSEPNPYTESWVFFSDDSPYASWYHGSRVIFVNTADGSYTINDVEIYPKGLSSEYEEISTAIRPDPIAMDGVPFVPNPEKVESNYNYALIIVAMDEPRNWYNTSLIYSVLKQNYSYQVNNIFVLYNYVGYTHLSGFTNNLDNEDPVNDIDGPATYANIQTTITDLTETLGHGD